MKKGYIFRTIRGYYAKDPFENGSMWTNFINMAKIYDTEDDIESFLNHDGIIKKLGIIDMVLVETVFYIND